MLAHCFAARTGRASRSRVVLEAAGVDRDAVMADFCQQRRRAELRAHIVEMIRTRMSETPEVMTVAEARLTNAVLGVQEAYLDSAQRAIIEDFGSLSGYLPASGVTPRTSAAAHHLRR